MKVRITHQKIQPGGPILIDGSEPYRELGEVEFDAVPQAGQTLFFGDMRELDIIDVSPEWRDGAFRVAIMVRGDDDEVDAFLAMLEAEG